MNIQQTRLLLQQRGIPEPTGPVLSKMLSYRKNRKYGSPIQDLGHLISWAESNRSTPSTQFILGLLTLLTLRVAHGRRGWFLV